MSSRYRRILAVVLAMGMVLGLVVTAFADDAGTQSPGQGSGSLTDDPDPVDPGPVNPGPSYNYDDDDDNQVTFKSGTGYTLEAQSGTSTKKDGSVEVTLTTSKISESKIPDITPDDAYYKITGWAILKNGELEEIDLEDYRFTRSNTDVYAVCEDVWPVFDDMKADRSDWYYRYVRDLSVAGVVNGNPGNIFKPEGNVTWGEALKLILLAAGYPEQPAVDSHWASGYLLKARTDGLVAADAVIDLNAPITRLEYGRVAALALGLEASDSETPFADTEDGLILALYDSGIVEGSFDTEGNRLYAPDQNIRRSELSTVIWRINNYDAV